MPFGRNERVGVVWSTSDASDVPDDKLKTISAILDETPVLSTEQMHLLSFAADYYLHAPGEVVHAALPKGLREGRNAAATETRYCISAGSDDPGARAPAQSALYQAIAAAGERGVTADKVRTVVRDANSLLRILLSKSLIARFEQPLVDSPVVLAGEAGPTLNQEQQAAVAAVNCADGFQVTVIDGVTGSGKTEVYLTIMRDVLAQGRQVLVVVPEIGLTPQLADRFERRLGFRPAMLHSELNESEKLSAWRRAAAGTAGVVIGTRSAIFTALANPGLIVIDEEHDASLKQQEGFRYSARDLAVVRAKHLDVPLVLGSATPSLESLHNIALGRYRCVQLTQRASTVAPPTIRLIDLNVHGEHEGLAGPLRDAMREHLEAGNQVMVYLNRRGFAPTLLCSDCGAIAHCSNCDARLTLHAGRQRLACHHCGFEQPVDAECSSCGGAMRALGAGTERVEQALAQDFPGEKILRIDSDTTSQRGQLDAHLAAARDGSARILVGTQMLTKGHHFPKLSLVGIVNLDQGLLGAEFRAAERLAQALIQVAGRAGREQHQGEVILQSAFPQHPLLRKLLEEGYAGFSKAGLAERRATSWPPFSAIALLRANAPRPDVALKFLQTLTPQIQQMVDADVRVLGPVRAVMEKRAGRYRAQLLLHAPQRSQLRPGLRALRIHLDQARAPNGVRWSLDIDPIDFQ